MKKAFFIALLALVAFAENALAQTYTLARTFQNPSTDIDDEFGLTIALFDNNLLIGALEDDTFGPNQGIVYLVEISTGNILRTFQDPTPNPNDGEVGFGVSIAVNGNQILIGAHRDDVVDGDDGAVYLFDGLSGALLQTFNNPAPEGVGGGDLFGSSATFVGNNVLISSPGEDAEATNAGRVYLFDGATGVLIHTFLNPTPAIHATFGNRIAVAGNFIIIRSRFNEEASLDAGAVYVFDSSSFVLIRTILNPAPDPNDDFGSFVATDGNKILAGASGNDTGGTNSGVSYLFDGMTGTLLHTFLNPTAAANDLFGSAGGIFGSKVLIGAPFDDTGATDAGAAYLFDLNTHNLISTFSNPNPAFDDRFGSSFVVLGNDIYIGAPGQTQLNQGKVYCFVQQPIANAGMDKEICAGQSVTIGGNPTATSGTPPYIYSWTPMTGLNNATIANPTASSASTTTYTVQVTDANGAMATDQMIVTVNPKPVADAGVDRAVLFGLTTTLGGGSTASGGTPPYTYSWSPITGLNNPNAANPKARMTSTVTYTVTVTDAKGCITTDQVIVTVQGYVLLSNGYLKISKNKDSKGDIHSNNKIEFLAGAPGTHVGNLTAKDDIIIQTKNTIQGNATAGDDLFLYGTALITGIKQDHANVATVVVPGFSYSAGGSNVTVPVNGSKILAPGSYGTVFVDDKGTLNLSAGDYYMNSLDTDPSAIISINASSEPVNIYVVSNLQFDNSVQVKLTGGTSDKVLFVSLQNLKVSVGNKAIIYGTLIAPNAQVQLMNESKIKGGVYASSITLDPLVKFYHHTSPGTFPKEFEGDAYEVASDQSRVSSYQLEQNYPNPFNPSTTIGFTMPEAREVTLAIYNTNGQLVKTLVSGAMTAGRHSVIWDAHGTSGQAVVSGVYLAVFKAGEARQVRRLILMK